MVSRGERMTLRDSWRNRPRVVCHRILFSLRRMNLQKGYRRWVGRRFLLGLLLLGALGFLVLCLLLRDQRVRLVERFREMLAAFRFASLPVCPCAMSTIYSVLSPSKIIRCYRGITRCFQLSAASQRRPVPPHLAFSCSTFSCAINASA